MKSTRRLANGLILTPILLLPLATRAVGGRTDRSASDLFAASVVAAQGSIVFYPVGNQAVRRLVFFDPATRTVYEYGTGGDLENTWAPTELGAKFEKR